jgi:hypothetical protein
MTVGSGVKMVLNDAIVGYMPVTWRRFYEETKGSYKNSADSQQTGFIYSSDLAANPEYKTHLLCACLICVKQC